ncbi:hypothetical protein RDWZM_010434 [Blomia tropicalis]|uniref:ITPR-interacting domain-containing protein n=1 Tax=Blomia tropicalis TaxID=40697 RepID=A0A9Q0RIP2_BLOTA|nr:hypothetical protein RDWZM_010434 [Blomia tropicalis]
MEYSPSQSSSSSSTANDIEVIEVDQSNDQPKQQQQQKHQSITYQWEKSDSKHYGQETSSRMANTNKNNDRPPSIIEMKNVYSSLNSDISNSSVSSVESLLEARKENPEEILLALGFGGFCNESVDPLLRIPCRFFESQSKAKGINVGEIVQRQRDRVLNQKHQQQQQQQHHHHQKHSIPIEQTEEAIDHQNNQMEENDNNDRSNKSRMPKRLVMGPKTYQIETHEDGDHSSVEDIYSPKTSPINEETISSSGPTFSLSSSSEQQSSIVTQSNNSFEQYLTVPHVPLIYHRKLSCPNIEFDQTQLSQIQSSSPSSTDDNVNDNEKRPNSNNGRTQVSQSVNQFFSGVRNTPTSNMILNQPNLSINLSYFIETSLITTIQSLKLLLDFYRYFRFGMNDPLKSNGPSNDSGIGSIALTLQSNEQLNVDQSENDQHRLTLQNLYLDVLDVESMLFDCLEKFKHSSNWPIFVTKYVERLQKAVDKIVMIQESLRRLHRPQQQQQQQQQQKQKSANSIRD